MIDNESATEFIGKHLDFVLNYLREMEPETILYIGSQSAYFLIGTPEECLNLIDRVSEEYFELFENNVMIAKEKLSGILPKIKNIEKAAISGKNNLMEFAQELNRLAVMEIQAVKDVSYAVKNVDLFTPMRGREIKDSYVKEVDSGIAIIIDGYERGKYWFKSEWDNDERKVKQNAKNGNG